MFKVELFLDGRQAKQKPSKSLDESSSRVCDGRMLVAVFRKRDVSHVI